MPSTAGSSRVLAGDPAKAPTSVRVVGTDEDASDFGPAPASDLRDVRAELFLANSGLTDKQLTELMDFGMLKPRPGTRYFDADALVVAETIANFTAFGLEPEMAEDLAKAVFDIRAYADAMVSLEQAASRAATTAAQFQRNIAVMREFGISAEAAAQNIQGFAEALGDLQREQSKTRQDLLGGLYGVYREDMQSLIQRVMSSGSKQQAFNEIASNSRGKSTNVCIAKGQAERGALAEKEFLRALGHTRCRQDA